MNTITTTMTFQGVTLKPLHREGQTWFRLPEIEAALGYAAAGSSLARIYARHADEFTASMTRVVKLATAGGKQAIRIFSLRGAHLLAMFSKTPIAKSFRIWVLDVLDGEVANPVVKMAPKYHYPLLSCKPAPRGDGFDNQAQFDLGELTNPRNRMPEIELLRQLEADGHDVTGARVRILALHHQLKYMAMSRKRMALWQDQLGKISQELKNHQHDQGLGALFSKQPEGIEKFPFASQLPSWKVA